MGTVGDGWGGEGYYVSSFFLSFFLSGFLGLCFFGFGLEFGIGILVVDWLLFCLVFFCLMLCFFFQG